LTLPSAGFENYGGIRRLAPVGKRDMPGHASAAVAARQVMCWHIMALRGVASLFKLFQK
jgi:hypothetical protein